MDTLKLKESIAQFFNIYITIKTQIKAFNHHGQVGIGDENSRLKYDHKSNSFHTSQIMNSYIIG